MAAYIAKNADGEQVNLVEILPEQIPGLVRYRDYRYGKAAVTIFRRG